MWVQWGVLQVVQLKTFHTEQNISFATERLSKFFLLLLESGGIKTQLLDHLKFAKVLTGQLSRTMAESIRNPNFFQYPGFSDCNRPVIKNVYVYDTYI